jgi:hypothetical protein
LDWLLVLLSESTGWLRAMRAVSENPPNLDEPTPMSPFWHT